MQRKYDAVVLFQASQRIHGPKMEHTTGDLDLEGVGASVTSTSGKRKKTKKKKTTRARQGTDPDLVTTPQAQAEVR